MTDLRKPRHDERLAPCPICGGKPWADSKNGAIYCDCGLRYHMNDECHPEWHRMDWTADEWNRLASVRAENDKLRELAMRFADYVGQDRCEGCVTKTRCNNGLMDECLLLTEIREIADGLGIVVEP